MAAQATPEWRPIHDNHAIEAMAVVVTFAQPLPDRLFKKMLDAAEAAAFAAGLMSRHSLNTMPFTINIAGSQILGQVSAGRIYNALMEASDGTPIPNRIAEQLRVEPNAVSFRTWQYVSWNTHFARMRELMTSALDIAMSAVTLSSVRLEYLDRFKFEGDTEFADVGLLLRTDLRLIAPHVFSVKDLWHSHTGAFVMTDGPNKRLQQLMIDALDEPLLPGQEGGTVRWVNITSALEERFAPEQSHEKEIDAGAVFKLLEMMHSQLKDVLAEVITDHFAKRIYLKEA